MHTRFALSMWAATKACLRRERTLMYRHRGVYYFRFMQVCPMLIVLPTLVPDSQGVHRE